MRRSRKTATPASRIASRSASLNVVGIGVEWLAPLGFLRFSYARPLNPDKATDRYFGDQTEEFQFSVGQAF